MSKYTLENTILYVDNVSGGYHGNVIIEGINILEKDVVTEGQTSGQIIAIVGRSGRGKSTFFKLLTGLMKPMTGQILIADTKHENNAKIVSAGDVGFVDQKYTLFRHKTVNQTLMFSLRNSSLSKEEKQKLIDDYLADWNLIKQKNQYPNELSGGQRQRTAILEQLLTSKNFIILDEPFSGLDVANVDSVKKYFNKVLTADSMNTIIFSTHDINLAVELAQSIYVIGHKLPDAATSTIVKSYDLKEMGLAWQPFGEEHIELVKEVTKTIKAS